MISFVSCFLLILEIEVVVCFPWSWAKDPFIEGMTDDGCDFPVYDLADPDVNVDFSLHFPFIARNMDLKWPAFQKWKKDEFLSIYGANFVRSGSESSIVHSGGVAENETTLLDMIDSMSKTKDQVYGDSFIFDTTILRAIPQLKEDFDVPSIFEAWDKPENESTGALWHMMSLGPSRSGLPFHGHGKTWLAVVYGIKQWFVYPPGYDPPQSVDKSFNPMFPVSRWAQDVYPKLIGFPKPPRTFFPVASDATGGEVYTNSGEEGFRPFECRQHSGDVMFLPRRWSHLTLNLGETIAIGGQETLYNEDRLNDAAAVLLTRPNNFDAWRDLGLAQFNMATVSLNSIRQATQTHGPHGPTRIEGHPRQLDELLARTQDTWVVLYLDSTVSMLNLTDVIDRWVTLSAAMRRSANVAIVDLASQYEIYDQDKITRETDLARVQADSNLIVSNVLTGDTLHFVDTAHTYDMLPIVKVHFGASALFNADIQFTPDIEGQTWWIDPLDVTAIEADVREMMRSEDLAEGSIATAPVKLQREYKEALRNMKRALQIKPMQPELLCMTGEVAGLARDFKSMHAVVSSAVAILDGVDRKEMAPISLASTYHKLSHIYIKLRMWSDALPIMLKSVETLPTFLPALSDIVYIHTMAGDRAAAEYALEVLKITVQDAPKKLSDVKQLTEQIRNIPWR